MFFDNAPAATTRHDPGGPDGRRDPRRVLGRVHAGTSSCHEVTYSPAEIGDDGDPGGRRRRVPRRLERLHRPAAAGSRSTAAQAKFDPAGGRRRRRPGRVGLASLAGRRRRRRHAAPADYAHLRQFAFNRGLSKIINRRSRPRSTSPTTDVRRADRHRHPTRSRSTGSAPGRRRTSSRLSSTFDDADANTETQTVRAVLRRQLRLAAQPGHDVRVPHDEPRPIRRRTSCGGSSRLIDIWDQVDVTVGSPGGGGFILRAVSSSKASTNRCSHSGADLRRRHAHPRLCRRKRSTT